MKLNASQLEAFWTVAKLLSFTKAAETLHVTQSALSQRIAKLEEELETTLFIRDRTSLRLTESGEKVLRFCQINESAESELLNNLKSDQSTLAGTLRVGGFSSVNRSIVIPALRNLMIKNPRLSFQLVTRELVELESLLRSSEVDYIITNKKSKASDIESLFLGYEENVLVQSKKFEDDDIYLDHDPLDVTTKGYFSQNSLQIKNAKMRYLDDVYGLIDGVKNGYGKAILPLHLIENEKDLDIINPKRTLRVSVYLQYYTQPYYRKIHSEFLSEIQNHFRQVLHPSK